jgi:hypothetical protein
MRGDPSCILNAKVVYVRPGLPKPFLKIVNQLCCKTPDFGRWNASAMTEALAGLFRPRVEGSIEPMQLP